MHCQLLLHAEQEYWGDNLSILKVCLFVKKPVTPLGAIGHVVVFSRYDRTNLNPEKWPKVT